MTKDQAQIIACKCGRVALEAVGDPIATTVCRCTSCRKAGQQLDELPGSTPVLSPDGGTHFVLFRKDRLRCLRGDRLLAEHRLSAESPTRRVVATCCNTAMFLDFTKGHWLSIYRGRVPLTGEIEGEKSGFFVPRLLWAWVRMSFRIPRIDYVRRSIDTPAASEDRGLR